MSQQITQLDGSSNIDLTNHDCEPKQIIVNCGSGGDGITYELEEINYDANVDTLPFTASSDTTDFYVCVDALTGDLDLTGQLPTNLQAGSTATVYYNDQSNQHKILFDDGKKVHDFVNCYGENYRFRWTGTEWRLI